MRITRVEIEARQNFMPPKWMNYPEFLSGPNKATTDVQNLLHLNGFKLANYSCKKVRCKSAQTICIKHCDCGLSVYETFFLCKKRGQNSLFMPMFLDDENGHF